MKGKTISKNTLIEQLQNQLTSQFNYLEDLMHIEEPDDLDDWDEEACEVNTVIHTLLYVLDCVEHERQLDGV